MRQFTTILFAFFTVIVFLSRAGSVYAAATPITGNNPLVVLTPSPSVSPVLTTPDTTATDNEWVPDQTVTFLGEAASRSAILLDWALVNYHWGYIETTIQTSWATTRNIVFALLILVVIIAAAVIIITGGANVTVLVFARKFIYIVLLITFSYAIVSLLYQIIDILQGFFLRKADGTVIAAKDIVQMSFSYSSIVGYRKLGATNFEAAFISELLIQLTVLTNYAMVIILTVRKIILWLFLVVSPIFPLTLLYFPIKNVSKRWLFEFFRWLLYAPLFALFLSALVTIWQNRINILPFNFFSPQPYIFPTAISILIGGPGQTLSLTNSVNYN
ncbi:MAG TPA: hypothetical protein VGT05_04650, partial [Patescibacteria group bacterium]|nr:hypothetical protein [Patescibacteria group bacterium]